MRRNFEELRSFLHDHYPALRQADTIRGELYPPPPMAHAIASAGSFLQMGGLAMALGGALIFDKLGLPEPFLVSVLRQNPLRAIVGITVVNSFCSSFLKTDAFEVSIDGELVFSRLEQRGKFPSGALIMRALEERGLRSAKSF